MAIVTIPSKDWKNAKISVKLKNGLFVEGRDCLESPCGEHDRILSYIDKGILYCVPMSEVEFFSFTFDE
ncbi:MAG: hypothetical protein EOL93_10160 [Epsilonproteobacteria bacterium]|nr:hypothetical protein [Campylobacterota bacterium]